MDNRIHIGKIEYISLPSEKLANVPAKIDTGADISAIWATNIERKNNRIYYTLFDKKSPYYNSKKLSTSDFSISSIKNSFGQTELRYKVRIPIILGGKRILATFTLANRANNEYPVLIGRRTLHGKFLVDVSIKPKKNKITLIKKGA
ncbi:ATP-dependent zinc protease [bacterium]|nr:ATP-dependent zinc protease [bacterium]